MSSLDEEPESSSYALDQSPNPFEIAGSFELDADRDDELGDGPELSAPLDEDTPSGYSGLGPSKNGPRKGSIGQHHRKTPQPADLEDSHDVVEGRSSTISNQLPHYTITEREIGKTYYSVKFRQVQSGTFYDRPAWLLVLDAAFHSSNSKDYRFKAVEITIDFSERNGHFPGEVTAFSPKVMYGAAKMESSKWHWEVSAAPNVAFPPATVELGRIKVGRETEYAIAHMLKLEGTARGLPKSRKVVWSVEERKMDGIPTYLPPLALIVTHLPGQTLFAKVTVKADTGFSMNPRRWPLFSGDNAQAIPLDPDGPRQGMKLVNSVLDTFNLGQYVQQYLADEEIRPSTDAFDAQK